MFNFDAIASLRDSGITVNNQMTAVSIAQDLPGTQQDFEDRIFRATGVCYKLSFPEQARMLYINFVDDVIGEYSRKDEVRTGPSLLRAQSRTEKYFDVFTSKNPTKDRLKWTLAGKGEYEARVAELTATHKRPASKQARAVEIVRANPTKSNKELQAMFRDQLALTANGAATYVYNCLKIVRAEQSQPSSD
jgi:hypothetical protein